MQYTNDSPDAELINAMFLASEGYSVMTYEVNVVLNPEGIKAPQDNEKVH